MPYLLKSQRPDLHMAGTSQQPQVVLGYRHLPVHHPFIITVYRRHQAQYEIHNIVCVHNRYNNNPPLHISIHFQILAVAVVAG
jgi:hypothetical protein